jgi:signal transduction histidine kinase
VTLLGPHASAVTRQRVQLVVAGGLLAGTLLAIAAALDLLGAEQPDWWLVVTAAAALLLAGALAGLLTAVRREASRVLAAAAALTGLGAAVLLALVVTVLVLGRLPHADERSIVVPALVGTAAAALAVAPLRRAVVGATQRSTIGLRRSPEAVLESFGESSRDVPLEELLRQLAESLRASLGVHSVEVWTGDNTGIARLLSVPHRASATTRLGAEDGAVLRRAGVAGEAWLALWLPQLLVGRADAQVRVAPVGYGSDLLGALVVEQPPESERIRSDDERALGEISRRLGVVLHNRSLDAALRASLDDVRRTNDELRASRLRLVSAADAERRRIERDIHDGAQQHLVALAVNLGLARQLLLDESEDRAAVAEILDEVTTDVRTTIAEVRDLAHGIYPPLLRQAGLPDALKAAAQRSTVPVSVEAADVGRPGPDVEAALYFCVLEALQNVAKHAPDATATVRLAVDEATSELVLAVADDGPGFEPSPIGGGQGQQNMTDRLGAVGGTVTWTSRTADAQVDGDGDRTASGTTVVLRVPVPAPDPRAVQDPVP